MCVDGATSVAYRRMCDKRYPSLLANALPASGAEVPSTVAAVRRIPLAFAEKRDASSVTLLITLGASELKADSATSL